MVLLKQFGSVGRIQNASLDDLQKVSGIGKELAKKIYDVSKNEEENK